MAPRWCAALGIRSSSLSAGGFQKRDSTKPGADQGLQHPRGSPARPPHAHPSEMAIPFLRNLRGISSSAGLTLMQLGTKLSRTRPLGAAERRISWFRGPAAAGERKGER